MITPERLRELLRYEPQTGLFWWLIRTSNRVNMGKPAGSFDRYGYRCIRIDRRDYRAHRLAWLHVYGAWPSDCLDHINGERSDNRIGNLREATNSENQHNRGKSSNNTSGFKGVTWHASESKWQAQIGINGKIKYLGKFTCKHAAHAAYCDAATQHHKEFARKE